MAASKIDFKEKKGKQSKAKILILRLSARFAELTFGPVLFRQNLSKAKHSHQKGCILAWKCLTIVVPLTISNNDLSISINENCLSSSREDGLTQFVSLCVHIKLSSQNSRGKRAASSAWLSFPGSWSIHLTDFHLQVWWVGMLVCEIICFAFLSCLKLYPDFESMVLFIGNICRLSSHLSIWLRCPRCSRLTCCCVLSSLLWLLWCVLLLCITQGTFSVSFWVS